MRDPATKKCTIPGKSSILVPG